MNKLFNFKLKHDFAKIKESDLLTIINNNTNLSYSYLSLLISSIIICTLGLLINSTPIIIGGMLISPMMWPLLKISVGIAFGENKYIYTALKIFIISILIGFISSYLISLVSPIKQINPAIIARTSPTLIDLIIAFTSGIIGALAITQKRISDSLAGVAIAVAIMPPLCVIGIGLALGNISIFVNSFILFSTNIIAIIFAAIIVFLFIGLNHKDSPKKEKIENQLRNKGISIVVGLVVFIALILFYLLQNYSFKNISYNTVEHVISENLSTISKDIKIKNIKTEIPSFNSNQIDIEASIALPENIEMTKEQKQTIIYNLTDSLNTKVNLTFYIEKVIVF